MGSNAGHWTRFGFADWLVYAIVRALGLAWYIDAESKVDYLQHADQEMGANVGAAAARNRLSTLHNGWYRSQFTATAKLAATITPDPVLRAELVELVNMFLRDSPSSRVRLAGYCRQLRRRPRDQVALAAMVLVGLW